MQEAEPAARQPHPFVTENLVQWKGLPSSEATWEDAAKLISAFPTHHLEDKVKLLAEGIVIPADKAIKVYQRRNKKKDGSN